MTRYHVADAGPCETLRQQINAGWRAAPAALAALAERYVGELIKRMQVPT